MSIFSRVSVEEYSQDVGLEIPSVHGFSHLVGYSPNGPVEFSTLHFLLIVCHCLIFFLAPVNLMKMHDLGK